MPQEAARPPARRAIPPLGARGVMKGAERSRQGAVFRTKKVQRDAGLLRAENGARTRDLNLGKVALYQLSYFRKSGMQIYGNFLISQIFRRFFIVAARAEHSSIFFRAK